jgi:hypothetical protein
VECTELRRQVLALHEDVWLEDEHRQTEYRNVHSQTQSVLLIFCEGWPDVRISYQRGWNYLGDAAASVMRAIVGAYYRPGGRVFRAMMARLPAGARIERHRDMHPSFAVSHRIHIPMQTNADVAFIVGTQRIQTEVGVAFELNNRLPHEVSNYGPTPRIHFIFDYAPPSLA